MACISVLLSTTLLVFTCDFCLGSPSLKALKIKTDGLKANLKDQDVISTKSETPKDKKQFSISQANPAIWIREISAWYSNNRDRTHHDSKLDGKSSGTKFVTMTTETPQDDNDTAINSTGDIINERLQRNETKPKNVTGMTRDSILTLPTILGMSVVPPHLGNASIVSSNFTSSNQTMNSNNTNPANSSDIAERRFPDPGVITNATIYGFFSKFNQSHFNYTNNDKGFKFGGVVLPIESESHKNQDGPTKAPAKKMKRELSHFSDHFHHEEHVDECDDKRQCPKRLYCYHHRCYECHALRSDCDDSYECCGDLECIYGVCLKKPKKSAGSFCDDAKDCGKDMCCVLEPTINHHHPICKPRLALYHECSSILYHKVSHWHEQPECGPCERGLSCIDKGHHSEHFVCIKEGIVDDRQTIIND